MELFDALSNDVMMLILRYLDVPDLVHLSETSWSLRRLASDDRLWQPLVREWTDYDAFVELESQQKELQVQQKKLARKKRKGAKVKSAAGYWMGVYGQNFRQRRMGCIWIPDVWEKRIANSCITDTGAKIVVFGDGGSGKTSTVFQFVQSSFACEYDPTIEDTYRKELLVDDVQVVFDILDTAGPEEYSALRDQNMRDGEGFIVMYSVTNRESYESVGTYIEALMRVKDTIDPPPIIIVGNKVDLLGDSISDKERLRRAVSVGEGKALANRFGVPFIESSARLGVNVDEIFAYLARLIAAHRSAPPPPEKKCVVQ